MPPKSMRSLLSKAKKAFESFKTADKQMRQRRLEYEASMVVAQVQAST